MSGKGPYGLDEDLETLRESIGALAVPRLEQIQRKRDLLRVAKNAAGNYSVSRLLNGLFEDNVRATAPYEWSESERIADRLGRLPGAGNAFVPISPEALAPQHRDLTAGVAGAGGYLVETANPGDMFVAALRNTSVMRRMGVQRISIQGNASVPRGAGGVSTGWIPSEGTTITESTHAFSVGAATPKHVAAYAEASRLLLKQTSSAAQGFILGEMARAVSEALDTALIAGSGAAGQPLGILNTSGIGTQAGASLAYSGVLNMLETIETAKGLVMPEATGWAVNPASAEILRGRERAAGNGYIMDNNAIAGYRALSSGSVPAGTALLGDWGRVAIIEWGVLEIGTDPYGVNSALFKVGMVGIRAIWACDVLVLQPASFCAATSIT